MDACTKNRKRLKRLSALASAVGCVLIAAAQGPPPAPADSASAPAAQFPSAAGHATAALAYHIIPAPGGTFGYDILSDGRLLIHQTHLPGRAGNEGCPTREQAERLAQLVIAKIQRGEMPPTITQDELKTLEIP